MVEEVPIYRQDSAIPVEVVRVEPEQIVRPPHAGFWWARTQGCKWWNLIVRVWGDPPYYSIDIWDIKENVLLKDTKVHYIHETGPLIALDMPDIVGGREDWKVRF